MKFHRWLNHIEMMCRKQGRQLWLLRFYELHPTPLGFDHGIVPVILSYLDDLFYIIMLFALSLPVGTQR